VPEADSGREGNAGLGGPGTLQGASDAQPRAGGSGLGTEGGRRTLWIALAVWGPGLMVMLADTDVGSLATAAQSGARFGYAMVLPLVALIPVLYLVKEMTVRLGILTGQGHAALIRRHFGRGWAAAASLALLASAMGALVTEFAGVAGVGQMFGVPRWLSVPVAAAFLVGVASTGSYRRSERVGIAVGLAELVFLPAMVLSHPRLPELLSGMVTVPRAAPAFLFRLAANLGAVVMPWMIFYQQGAVVDRGLTRQSIGAERRNTMFGAVLTQLVMIAVVVALAATLGTTHPGSTLRTVGQMAVALVPLLGSTGARVLLGVGVLGAGLVAALVASLAGAWALAEVFGWQHSLNRRPSRETAPFYGTYALALAAGALLVLTRTDLISLAVDAEVLNAFLLPVVLGFLLLLEARALPPAARRQGWRRWATVAVCGLVAAVGVLAVPISGGLR
jgi:Mn2+/Fe2+ NRAMP family transporter